MAGRNAGRSGRRWRQLAATVRARETHCYWCGMPIDWTIPRRDPQGRDNNDSGSVEHIHPRSTHPHLAEDPGNLAASHLGCNRHAGVGRDNVVELGVTSQDWT
jgi:5-methylcytosine-specific restriction endonuclease McrA